MLIFCSLHSSTQSCQSQLLLQLFSNLRINNKNESNIITYKYNLPNSMKIVPRQKSIQSSMNKAATVNIASMQFQDPVFTATDLENIEAIISSLQSELNQNQPMPKNMIKINIEYLKRIRGNNKSRFEGEKKGKFRILKSLKKNTVHEQKSVSPQIKVMKGSDKLKTKQNLGKPGSKLEIKKGVGEGEVKKINYEEVVSKMKSSLKKYVQANDEKGKVIASLKSRVSEFEKENEKLVQKLGLFQEKEKESVIAINANFTIKCEMCSKCQQNEKQQKFTGEGVASERILVKKLSLLHEQKSKQENYKLSQNCMNDQIEELLRMVIFRSCQVEKLQAHLAKGERKRSRWNSYDE